jgi:Na+/citrate or Na+/malate symporter
VSERWWQVVDLRIGVIPLPVYVVLLAIITGFTVSGKVPSELIATGFVVGRLINMYPIDTAVVTACHAARAAPATWPS